MRTSLQYTERGRQWSVSAWKDKTRAPRRKRPGKNIFAFLDACGPPIQPKEWLTCEECGCGVDKRYAKRKKRVCIDCKTYVSSDPSAIYCAVCKKRTRDYGWLSAEDKSMACLKCQNDHKKPNTRTVTREEAIEISQNTLAKAEKAREQFAAEEAKVGIVEKPSVVRRIYDLFFSSEKDVA